MPRTVQITIPGDQTDDLVAELKQIEGVLGLRVQRGISQEPPGDVLAVELLDRSLPELVRRMDHRQIGRQPGTSWTTSEVSSLVQASAIEAIVTDTSEATWEEVEWTLGRESNMTANMLAVMAIAGAVAAVGLATNSLHYVMAAMVIAPGFEPILRISLGIVTRTAAWRRGVTNTAMGYGALVLGAVAAALVLRMMGISPFPGQQSYLPPGSLLTYWTTISAASVLLSAVAAVAGTLLVLSSRSVLTAGVMIALALVPGATIFAMALTIGDWGLAGLGALRWAVDVALVLALSLAVFGWKQGRSFRREVRGTAAVG